MSTETSTETSTESTVSTTDVNVTAGPAATETSATPEAQETGSTSEVTTAVTNPTETSTGTGSAPKGDVQNWGSTGSEIGDSIQQVLIDSGVSQSDAKALLWDAIKSGDVSKIDKTALAGKVGQASANIIMHGVTNYIGEIQAKKEAATKIIYDAAGGKETWDVLVPWVNQNVQGDELTSVKSLLDQGGLASELAVKHLVNLYNSDTSNSELGGATTKTMTADAASTGPSVEPLSKREYGRLVQKAKNDGERSALYVRRQAGIKAGL